MRKWNNMTFSFNFKWFANLMKSICRMLKYTNINNISGDARGYSRTRKMESSRLRRGRETFFAAICPIKLTWQCRRINSRHVPPSPLYSPLFFGNVFKARGAANRKRLCLATVAATWRSLPDVLALDLSSWRRSRSCTARGNSLAVPSPFPATISLIPWNEGN